MIRKSDKHIVETGKQLDDISDTYIEGWKRGNYVLRCLSDIPKGYGIERRDDNTGEKIQVCLNYADHDGLYKIEIIHRPKQPARHYVPGKVKQILLDPEELDMLCDILSQAIE